MKKTTGFVACAIALTVLFYLLAYYLLPPPPPSASMVALFAAVALAITWIGQSALRKYQSKGQKSNTTGTGAVIGFVVLGGLFCNGFFSAHGQSGSPDQQKTSRKSATAQSESMSAPHRMSTLCRFTSGPRTGTIYDFADSTPLPVGAPCRDGAGSAGVVIAEYAPEHWTSNFSPDSAESDSAAAADGSSSMPRVTGTAFLLSSQTEETGYGLYSYVLMSHRPEASETPRWEACLKALLELPTAAAVKKYVPAWRVNVTYIPVDAMAANWKSLSLDEQVKYVEVHYDFARAAAMLASLSGKTGQGPVVISLLKPLNLSRHPHPVLVQDMSMAQPVLMESYISYFVQQAARDQFWRQSTLARLGLTLRNGLETTAVGLGMSKDAVQAWVKYFS